MELKLNGKQFDFFNNFMLSLKYDSVASAFSFNAFFNPDNPQHKELFKPGSYRVAEVSHNGELLIRGTVLSHAFSQQAQKQLSGIGGYSVTGVLEDCEIPTSIYPLQSDGLTLKEIARKLIEPFGLSMVIDPAVAALMNEVYDVTNAKESQTVKAYLTELATQKNIVLSHTAAGSLFFTKAKTKQKPILQFDGAGIPGTSMSLSFNGQPMHSHITVIKDADEDEGNAGEAELTNPLVRSVEKTILTEVGSTWDFLGNVLPVFKSSTKIYNYRPRVSTQSSGTDVDTDKAAKTVLQEELKNITLTIVTDRWEVNGKILKPNNIVSVKNPELYLYRKTNWFVESISFQGDNKSTTATLTCVLPSVYDDSTPVNIFN